MPKNDGTAPDEGVSAVASMADVSEVAEEAKTPEDLAKLPQTPETHRALRAMESDVKIPADLDKVSNAKAKELAEAGLVDDSDLPGKMYKRKYDGFTTRIPNYTFEAYPDFMKDEWDEIKLPTSEPS